MSESYTSLNFNLRIFSRESSLKSTEICTSSTHPSSYLSHLSVLNHSVSSVQSLSCVWLFAIPWTTARQASLSITNSQSLPKLMCSESVMPSNHLILCCPLLLLPSIFPRVRVFSNELALCIRWSKYWSFSISPSNEYSGLISFRMDWLDLLAVQGTPKSLLQHHNSKASILQRSALFMVQLSHLYMTTGKNNSERSWKKTVIARGWGSGQ